MHDGIRSYEVQAVGLRYVYVAEAQPQEKRQLRLFELAELIVRPADPKSFLYNECVRLHNNK